ncbi:MAG: type VI secretion system membrane subunit TssM [Luteitalea sp.]|nr:type VI secretion system membrane subunit TssM [Luteitalea sp.]
MFSFLKLRALLILLGFLLLALFIWYAGPYFAFATYHPLAPVSSRVIAIALIVALWSVWVLVRQLRAYRASDQLAAAVVQQAAADQEQPSAEAVQLRERFEEAVATLKQTRRSGHSLYDLPWYVIIGAPGSGKTTALLNSGLEFPLEQRVGRGALRGVGGTRNCDWWFTNEAVFLDTAGRYTTQDSDRASDSAGWAEFLGLLRKYRKRRPLNGVILTISAHDLMVQGEPGREAHVEAARRRLNELNRELHIRLPVYVLVTKCDLVAGFTEYFDDLAQEGRAQVWGVTFPYEQTVGGEATQAFPAEFDQLMARLNARVYARVEEDRDVRRRTKLFAFPQQMAALGGMLTQFVGELFGSTRFDQQILLRGVYFTSGTQEGTPIDRLLGAIGRRFGVTAEAVVPPTGRGKAYFVERLLKEVLIGESGLAGVNRRLEVRKAAWQLGSYAAIVLVALVGVLVLSVSCGRNRTYLAETAADITKLQQVPSVSADGSLDALLPRLDAIRAVADSANRHRDKTPWAMRWGLYQGRSVGNAARDAYLRELDGALLPRLTARIEKRLVEFAPEPEKLYEYLKAYLMLGEPKRLDKEHLRFVADLEWQTMKSAAPDRDGRLGEAALPSSLSKHFQSLLDSGDTLRAITLNPSLVAQARSTIRQASIPRLIYSRLNRAYTDDSARAVRLDLAAGVGVEEVLRRRSGRSLAEPLSSVYSRRVFQQVTRRDMSKLVAQFAADDWVWGEGGAAARNPSRLAAEVTHLYERDYIATWEGILDDLELVPFTTVSEARDALGTLAGPASPLRGLLTAVVENTTLVEHPKPKESSTAAPSVREKLTDRLGGLFRQEAEPTGKPDALPGALVTAQFQPIHRLMQGEPGNAPLDRLLGRIGQIQQHLRSLGPEVGAATPLDALSDPTLRDMVQSLQQEAEALPPVIQTLITQIGRRAEATVISGASSELETLYSQNVLRQCTTLLAGRYPFATDSRTDVRLSDFARLLGYGGVFDKFFKEHLEPLVDRSQSPWTWRRGAVRGSPAMLHQFEGAERLRELFFNRTSSTLRVPFTVTIADVDASTTHFALEGDGQVFDYRVPQRSVTAVWPGPKPGAGAAVVFADGSGRRERNPLFHGPWAWFRLIDAAREERESDVRSALIFQARGHRARVIIEADSVYNPFAKRDWRRFTCEL